MGDASPSFGSVNEHRAASAKGQDVPTGPLLISSNFLEHRQEIV
jgi:hypothetical protein